MRTYGRLLYSPVHRVWAMDNLEPHVAIRLKQLFPRVPKYSTGPFMFPDDDNHAADLDWFISRYPLEMADEVRARLRDGRLAFEAMQAEMERILLPDFEMPPYVGIREGQELRHYQKQAVETLRRSKGLLCGDEVGLGKTFVGAGACLIEDALPAFVVCQPHLQKQWCSVIEAFTTLQTHPIKKTRPYSLPKAQVYVGRYTQLAGWVDIFGKVKFPLVIFDEPQELRTGTKTGKGQGALVLSENARYRLGLSATPIYNYGFEIHQIMQFIRPDVLGSGGDFYREWCPTGKIGDPKALGTFLREQHAFLRRTKHDVGQEMPPVNKIVDQVAYDAKTVNSIEELARQLAIKATTATFTERGKAVRDLDMLVRHNTGVAKAPYVADFVRILVEGGEPVVLVGWHRDVYDIWNKKLADLEPAMYTGSESPSQKDAAKNRFTSGETNLLILSLRSGAGLDGLQFRSSTIVFGELDWSPGIHHQCIGRLDREGQKDPVTAIFLVTDEGSDPPMMEVLGLKASEAAHIVDPHLGVQEVYSDVGHLRALVQRYLKKKKAA